MAMRYMYYYYISNTVTVAAREIKRDRERRRTGRDSTMASIAFMGLPIYLR